MCNMSKIGLDKGTTWYKSNTQELFSYDNEFSVVVEGSLFVFVVGQEILSFENGL